MSSHAGAASTAQPLRGLGIVVTRPREQAAHLSEQVRAAGGHPVEFPALEIGDLPDTPARRALIDALERFDIAVFVSPTAASRGMALVRSRRVLPAGLAIAAIGSGTARELARLGVGPVIAPEQGADSEALLALPQFAALAGRSVVVFRGVGGRELLGQTLAGRGASVQYVECYRRLRPQADPQPLLGAFQRGGIHAVTVTSGEALGNLCALLGAPGEPWLRRTPLFVPHARIAERAQALGIARVVVTGSGDTAMVAALVRFFAPGP